MAGSCFTVAMSPTRTGFPDFPVAGFAAETFRSSICWSEVKEPPTWMVRLLPDSEKEAGRDRRSPGLEGLGQRPGVQAGRGELPVVGDDGDLEVLDAVDRDLADALDVLERRDDRAVQLVGERLLVLVGGDGEDDGRDVVRRAG